MHIKITRTTEEHDHRPPLWSYLLGPKPYTDHLIHLQIKFTEEELAVMRSGLERRCVIREPWNPNHTSSSYSEHEDDSYREIRVEHLIWDHENNKPRCLGKCRTLVEANNFESELREALQKLKTVITHHSKASQRADRDYEL